jgi:hypothetical protein
MKEFLHSLFLPKITNNFRPGLLHHKALFSLVIFFFSAGIVMSLVRHNLPSVLGISSNVSQDQLLIITNEYRQQNGLPVLSLNPELSQAAQSKASDMFAKNYWAHVSPDGTTPWIFIKSAGYGYIYAGENLARGYNSAQDVIAAWMASPEHRQNMLSSNYQNVGFAVETGNLTGEDTVLVVEMLGSTALAVVPSNQEAVNAAPTVKAPVAEVPSITPSPVVVASNNSNNQELPKNTLGISKSTSKVQPTPANSIPQIEPLFAAASFSFNPAEGIVSLFILILILDMILIERRKIVRFVGHNIDHIFYLSLILVVIFVLAKGLII